MNGYTPRYPKLSEADSPAAAELREKAQPLMGTAYEFKYASHIIGLDAEGRRKVSSWYVFGHTTVTTYGEAINEIALRVAQCKRETAACQ